MTLLLILLLITGACWAICVWFSPNLLRQLAAWLLTRADVLDAAKREHEARNAYWRREFRLDQKLRPGAYGVRFEEPE